MRKQLQGALPLTSTTLLCRLPQFLSLVLVGLLCAFLFAPPSHAQITIAEARAKGVDSTVTVVGTVTRAYGAYARIQDTTGATGASALMIRQTADNSLANGFRSDVADGTITQGTRLQVTGTLSQFSGLLQINNEDLDSYSVEGQGEPPEPQTVSLSDIQAPDGEDYESELIRVEGLTFPDASGQLESGTTYTVEDEEGTSYQFRVQDSLETAVIGAPIPEGTFTYKGVLGQFNNFSGPDTHEGYQFIPIRPQTALFVGQITIAEARAKGVDSTVTVQATVTRAYGAYARIQDMSGATGASALMIRQTADDSLANAFRSDIADGTITQGTRLQVTGTLSQFSGLLQINNEDLESYTVQLQGMSPEPQTVSLSDIQAPDGEDYESELIRVEGLTFPDASGQLESGTTYTVEDEEGTSYQFRVQDSLETAVIGAPIPEGTFTYKGVLGQFNNFSGPDTHEGYQFIPIHPKTALPVELASFDAVQSGSSVELTWQTASETNNAGFRVQHQTGSGWTTLGFVESNAPGGTATEVQSYRFTVGQELDPGTHRFRLTQMDLDGSTHPSKVVEVNVQMDQVLSLSAPAPNPTSGQVSLSFAVKEKTDATLSVYNVLGQKVATLYDGTPRAEQMRSVTFDTSDLSSGVYVVRLQAGGQTQTRRLTVVR